MADSGTSTTAPHVEVDDWQGAASRSWLLGLCVDLATCAGLALFVSGRSELRVPMLGQLHWTTYGRFFLPAAACLVCGVQPQRSALFLLGDRLRRRIDALPPHALTLLIWLSMLVVCAAHGIVVFRRHLAFMTAMDLAIYGNACRGALYSTMKGDVWIFADHFEPLLLLFTPLCRLTSPAAVLLVAQLLAFACGAYGVFALGRKQGWLPSSAWLASILYLLFAGNVAAIYYDFHLVALALGLTPWMWFALQARKYRLLLGLGLLSLGLKESAALSLAGLGAYLLCQREPAQRRLGMIFVATGLSTFLLISNVVFPLFRNGEPTMYYQKYYSHLGASPLEILKTIVTRPAVLAETLLAPNKLKYLAALLLPFLLVHVRKPVLLLPVLPAIAINMLSNDHNLTERIYHYESEIYPPLFAMSVIAFTQAPRLRALWLAVMLVVCVGPSPISVARGITITQHHRRLRKQLADFAPNDRSIATLQSIAAHLTDREGLYMFDYYGMQDDWRRAQVLLIGFPAPRVGIYPWGTLVTRVLPRMKKEMREIFRDPNDPRFRLYEVTASKSTLKRQSSPIMPPTRQRYSNGADGSAAAAAESLYRRLCRGSSVVPFNAVGPRGTLGPSFAWVRMMVQPARAMPPRAGLSLVQWTVVFAALGLALVLFVYGIRLPPVLRSRGDARTYMMTAIPLRTLSGIWHYAGARSIGMPLFDAAVRALVLAVARHATWARWIDVLSWVLLTIHVFAAAAFTRFAWALRVLPSRWAAVALWALLASCPALIGHTTTPLTDTLAIDVVLLGLVALHTGLGTSRLGWALSCVALAGVAFAFTVLLRPAFLAGVGALLLVACCSQIGTGLRKLLLPTVMLLVCLGTLAPFSMQCARAHGGGLCLQPAATFDPVRHAHVGLRGGRVLWRHAAAPGDILPVLPDAFMVDHFYTPCRLTHIAGMGESSLSGCLLSRPLLTPVLIVKKWIALFDHFRFTPYVERDTPTWLRWLSRGYDLLFWLGFALLPIWALASLRQLRLAKFAAALRDHAPLAALIAFSLVMLAEHTALHTEERFSLPLLPLCALSLVAYLDRALSRFAREGTRWAWPLSGYAALTCAIFVVQVVVWDGQMRATAPVIPTASATQRAVGVQGTHQAAALRR